MTQEKRTFTLKDVFVHQCICLKELNQFRMIYIYAQLSIEFVEKSRKC